MGGGGVNSDIHPECRYPRDKDINDQEIYLLCDPTATKIQITRIMMQHANTIRFQVGYMGTFHRFINLTPYMNDSKPDAIYCTAGGGTSTEIPINESATIVYKDANGNMMSILSDLGCDPSYPLSEFFLEFAIPSNFLTGKVPVNDTQYSLVIKISIGILRNDKFYQSNGKLILFHMGGYFNSDVYASSGNVYPSELSMLKMLMIRSSTISSISVMDPNILYARYLSIKDTPYYIGFGDCSSLRYTSHDSPLFDMINGRIDTIRTSGTYRNLGCVFSHCTNLLRSYYIDFSVIEEFYSFFRGCNNLTIDNLPLSPNNTIELGRLGYYVTNRWFFDYSISSIFSGISSGYPSSIRFVNVYDEPIDMSAESSFSSYTGGTIPPYIDPSIQITSTAYMFKNSTISSEHSDIIEAYNLSKNTKSSNMFYECTNVHKLIRLNMPKVTDIQSLYYGCNLTGQSLETNNVITLKNYLICDKVKYMQNLFNNVQFPANAFLDMIIPETCTNVGKMFQYSNLSKANIELTGNTNTDHMLYPMPLPIGDNRAEFMIKLNRNITYFNFKNLLSSTNPSSKVILRLFNIASYPESDFYKLINFTTILGIRTLTFGGYIDKELMILFGQKWADIVTNCDLSAGTTIKRNTILFDFTQTSGTSDKDFHIILNPLRWDDTKEYLQPEEYKTLFNWGTNDYNFHLVRIYLHDPVNNWKESYWSSVPQWGETDTAMTIFGFPSDGTKKPYPSFLPYNNLYRFPFPASWEE